MSTKMRFGAVAAVLALAQAGCGVIPGTASGEAKWRVASDTTATGFTFPESVGCDTTQKVLYVGNFGGTELKPAEKDGKGYISKVGLDGKVIEARFLPPSGRRSGASTASTKCATAPCSSPTGTRASSSADRHSRAGGNPVSRRDYLRL